MKAILALEDGRIFEGEAFGAEVEVSGEICFNTSMTGYQEVITDPSYRGQIVTMTYPLIGNYGTNDLDPESGGIHVRALVVAELCEIPSSWRSTESLDDYLKKNGIPGIQGIDTRALTKHLRTRGAMKAVLTTACDDPEAAVARAAAGEGVVGMDYVREVTTKKAYDWKDEDSRDWTIPNPCVGDKVIPDANGTDHYFELPEVRYDIVAYDFGIKHNMLRRLRQRGFRTHVVPADTSAEEVLARNPDGVFLSNGPGDPAALDYIHEEVAKILGKVPVFAICLGHQILGHAFGGKTFKLKFGHRGGNQPVQDLRSGQISITSQNHGFAVDAESLPDNVEVTHVNLNDRTVEGMSHKEMPVFSVQYHPEAAPGPNDAAYFFEEFAKLIDQNRESR